MGMKDGYEELMDMKNGKLMDMMEENEGWELK